VLHVNTILNPRSGFSIPSNLVSVEGVDIKTSRSRR